ncbi:MAG: hypothetical protein RB292_01090 [Patescibacteria group bacterium]|jgi:hypothetical protein|nr:hypothetical protein [Patescibacteria group bacterium]
MPKVFDSPIEELKFYLTMQIQAYHEEDFKLYDRLESKILEIEKKL